MSANDRKTTWAPVAEINRDDPNADGSLKESGEVFYNYDFNAMMDAVNRGVRVAFKVEYADGVDKWRFLQRFNATGLTFAEAASLSARAANARQRYYDLFVDGKIWSLNDDLTVDYVPRFRASRPGSENEGDIIEYGSPIEKIVFFRVDHQGSASGQDRKMNNVSYYPYLNETRIDLSHAQIYTAVQYNNLEFSKHCLLHAIDEWGKDNKEDYERVVKPRMCDVEARYLERGPGALNTLHLSDIARLLNVQFLLKRSTNRKVDSRPSTAAASGITISLGMVWGHVFYNKLHPEYPSMHSLNHALFQNNHLFTKEKIGRKRYRALQNALNMSPKKVIIRDTMWLVKTIMGTKLPGNRDIDPRFLQSEAAPDQRGQLPPRTLEAKKLEFVHCCLTGVVEPRAPQEEKEEKKDEGKAYTKTWPLQTVYYAADCESEIQRNEGKKKHAVYLIGGAPIEAKTPNDVFIRTSVVNFVNEIVSRERGAFNRLVHGERHRHKDSRAVTKLLSDAGLKKSGALRPIYKVIVYIHNLRYDRAVIQQEYGIKNVIEKDGQTYAVTVRRGLLPGFEIELRDSFKHLSYPLSELPVKMGLPEYLHKKERGIYYSYFQEETRGLAVPVRAYIASRNVQTVSETQALIDVNFVYNELNDHDEKLTLDSIICPDVFYEEYLKFDVLVLCAAMVAHREGMYEVCRAIDLPPLNVLDSYTISSFSMKICKQAGAYEGVPSYSHYTRKYIMESVRGGRCTPHPTFEGDYIDAKIADIDAVSLYPSAITCVDHFTNKSPVMLTEENCLEGEAFLRREADPAIVTVRITKVNRRLRFVPPIICYKGEDGVLQFTQDIPPEGLIVTVHSVDLFSYIRLHRIEFEVLYGLYWPKHTPDEKKNTNYPAILSKLYDQRAVYKGLKKEARKAGNKADEIKYDVAQLEMKLIMNSAYGKTIMRASTEKTTVMMRPSTEKNTGNTKDPQQWLLNQSFLVKGWYTTPHNFFITSYATDDSSTYCLYGSSVLAHSRAIMNRVWDACEKVECHIYYTDTDSMMIDYDKLPAVEEEYERQRQVDAASNHHYPSLLGDGLQQFNTDYSASSFAYYPEGDISQKTSYWPKEANEDDIYSMGMYCIRKKAYLHLLACDYKDSVTQETKTVYGLKFCMKGLPHAGVIYHAYNLPDKRGYVYEQYTHRCQRGLITLFQDLLEGDTHKIVINPKGKAKFYYTAGHVSTDEAPVSRTIMTRETQTHLSKKRKVPTTPTSHSFPALPPQCPGSPKKRMRLSNERAARILQLLREN
jgi:hypothetical protein